MAVASELSRRLTDEEEPIGKRLCLAQNVFQSSHLAIPNKEEIIVGWLCHLADKSPRKKKKSNSTDLYVDLEDIWKKLQSCITSSSRVHRFSVLDLKPSSKRAIVQVLCKHLQRDLKDENEISSLFECVTCVLDSHSFQRYLRQEIPLFCDFIQSAVTSLQHVRAQEGLKLTVIMAIRNFYRESFLRSDLNTFFLKAALFPLVNLIVVDDKHSKVLATEVKKCFEQILFPKSSVEFIQFLDALFRTDRKVPDLKSTKPLDKDKHTVPLNIIDAMRESLHLFHEEAVVNLYQTVFESFVCSLKINSIPSIFQMCVSLCHLVGISIVNSKCKVSSKKLRECVEQALPEPTVVSLSVLKSLVDVLSAKGVPLNSDISGTSFLDWLQMLVESLFPRFADLIERNQLIKLMASFTKLNPFTVEANVENILGFLTSKPLSPAERPAYTELLRVLFRMYHKMNRIHKVLAVFLTCLERGIFNHSNETDGKYLNACDWIPSEICEELAEFATAMPSGPAISTFEVLILHFKKGIDQSFSSTYGKGHGAKVFVQIVGDLLCSVLKGIRMVENSVAPHPRIGFSKVLKDLRDCLYVMGQSLLKVECLSSLKSFLNISYFWGAEALLIKLYATVGRASLLESIEDSSVCTNGALTYLHPYLTDEEWHIIREKGIKSVDSVCSDLLLQLDFQLLCALQLLENPLPTEATALAKKCLPLVLKKSKTDNNASFLTKEMTFNLVLLSRVLGTSEVVELAECLIPPLLSQFRSNYSPETAALLTERRTLACALIFSTFDSLEHTLRVSKRRKSENTVNRFSVSRAVLANLKSCSSLLVEAEIHQSSELTHSVKTILCSMTESVSEQLSIAVGIKEDDVKHFSDVNLVAIKDHLDLLQTLPLQGLMVYSRFAIFLSCISLALDCSHLPPSSEKTHILSMLYDHLLVGLAERKLMLRKHEHLSQPQLVKYLAHVIVNLGVSRHLLEMLVAEAVEEENALDYILEIVLILNKKFSKHKTNSENVLLATVLLQNLVSRKRLFEGNFDSNKEEGQQEKVRSALQSLVDSLCKLIEEQHCKPKEFMHLYALSLDFLVKSKAIDKLIHSLVPHFEDYCSVAVSKLQSTNTCHRRDAEVLLSTVFSHHKVLHEFIPSGLLRDVWAILIQNRNPSDGPIKLLSHYVSKDILDDLILKTVETYRSPDISNPEFPTTHLIELWCALLSCSSSVKANSELWLSAIRRLFDELHCFNRVPPNSLLEFLHKVVITTEIVMDMEMIDQCLLALNGIDLPVTIVEFVSTGEKYLSLLSALFFHRQVFALDCVPILFQKLQLLIRKLGNHSRSRDDLSQDNTVLLADLAYNVEKFVSSFTRPDFKVALKRVAAYLIADIISVFEVVTLCSAVKVHFQNMVYILISMIDKHSIQFLLRAMSPASVEIFKTLHANYTKFHAFKGKI